MPLSFTCPQCGKQYQRVRDRYVGKKMKCSCGQIMRLKSDDPPPVAANPSIERVEAILLDEESLPVAAKVASAQHEPTAEQPGAPAAEAQLKPNPRPVDPKSFKELGVDSLKKGGTGVEPAYEVSLAEPEITNIVSEPSVVESVAESMNEEDLLWVDMADSSNDVPVTAEDDEAESIATEPDEPVGVQRQRTESPNVPNIESVLDWATSASPAANDEPFSATQPSSLSCKGAHAEANDAPENDWIPVAAIEPIEDPASLPAPPRVADVAQPMAFGSLPAGKAIPTATEPASAPQVVATPSGHSVASVASPQGAPPATSGTAVPNPVVGSAPGGTSEVARTAAARYPQTDLAMPVQPAFVSHSVSSLAGGQSAGGPVAAPQAAYPEPVTPVPAYQQHREKIQRIRPPVTSQTIVATVASALGALFALVATIWYVQSLISSFSAWQTFARFSDGAPGFWTIAHLILTVVMLAASLAMLTSCGWALFTAIREMANGTRAEFPIRLAAITSTVFSISLLARAFFGLMAFLYFLNSVGRTNRSSDIASSLLWNLFLLILVLAIPVFVAVVGYRHGPARSRRF